MRAYDAATLAALQSRAGIKARNLIWIEARNRTTGDPETAGFWTGDQIARFTIGGVDRIYRAAGAMLSLDTLGSEVGVQVQMRRIALSPVNEAVELAIRGYDTRFAPIEVHRVLFDIAKGVPVAPPHRVFRGWIDEVEIVTAAAGGESVCVLTCASSARALTRVLTLKKSDESQRLRGGDRLNRHSDVTEPVEVPWGE